MNAATSPDDSQKERVDIATFNPVGILKERADKYKYNVQYAYTVRGPEHKPVFQATCILNDEHSTTGRGNTKRSAKTNASRLMLAYLDHSSDEVMSDEYQTGFTCNSDDTESIGVSDTQVDGDARDDWVVKLQVICVFNVRSSIFFFSSNSVFTKQSRSCRRTLTMSIMYTWRETRATGSVNYR